MKTIIHIALQIAIIATLLISGISDQAGPKNGELVLPFNEPVSSIKELIREALPVRSEIRHPHEMEDESLSKKLVSWFVIIAEKC